MSGEQSWLRKALDGVSWIGREKKHRKKQNSMGDVRKAPELGLHQVGPLLSAPASASRHLSAFIMCFFRKHPPCIVPTSPLLLSLSSR